MVFFLGKEETTQVGYVVVRKVSQPARSTRHTRWFSRWRDDVICHVTE